MEKEETPELPAYGKPGVVLDQQSHDEARPETFAGVLRFVCEWIDAIDKLRGHPERNGVQTELRNVAQALEERPALDAEIYQFLTPRQGGNNS